MVDLALVDVGQAPRDGTGDRLRASFMKINAGLLAIKSALEDVQSLKADIEHRHATGEIDGLGALALLDSLDGLPIDMQGAILARPALRAFAEISPAPTIVDGTLTLDLSTGSVFEVVLTEDVETLQVVQPPSAGLAGACSMILRQDATGGRSLSWPTSVKWDHGFPPVMTSAANAIDIYALVTRDGGATWYGMPGGQNFG